MRSFPSWIVCVLACGISLPAAAESSPVPDKVAPAIDQAIDAVYPALVQIWVLSPSHDNGRERKYQASGSGAIISSEGHVITNHHVAGKAVDIRCVLATKEEVPARLIGTDALAVIAVIKLDLSHRPKGATLPVAHFGSSEAIKIGDPVLAMGCPLAISQSVTRGIVSNKDMMMSRFESQGFELDGENVGSTVKWIGHDAVIFPGNSGGPLVDLGGSIVGINEIGMGLGGAIPGDLAKNVAEQIIAHGKVTRAWIGAGFHPLLKDGVGPDHGVLVSSIIPASPAERGGLQVGDVIMVIDDNPVSVRFEAELPGLTNLVQSKAIGKPIDVQVLRGEKEVRLSLVPESRDEARGKEVEAKEWGLTVRRLTVMEAKFLQRPDTRGILVGSVRPGGPANRAVPDLRDNDVITEVGGKPVDSLEAFQALTAAIVKDAKDPVATTVRFDRENEHELTVVEIGIRRQQDPPAAARKSWLPVATQVLSPKLATALDLKGKKGVRVTQVYPESVAAEAGFQVGDIITHIDDLPIEASSPQDSQVFEGMVRAYKPETRAEFTVIRDGKPTKVGVTLTAAPKQENEQKVYEDITFEFKVRDISYLDRVKHRWAKEESGALVIEVESGGWAAVATLQAGDLIKAIDGHPVADAKDLESRMKPIADKHATHVTVLVKRGIQTAFIELQPAWPDQH
ncbi:MAG: PDZ domain-containing protein [Planctomycetes bacterium]|nr:PDZ domain-containing protein [Planctomycetota bacterium]